MRSSGAHPDVNSPTVKDAFDAVERAMCRRCCGGIEEAIQRRLDVMYPLKECRRQVSSLSVAALKSLTDHLRYIREPLGVAIVHRISGDLKRTRGGTGSEWAGCHEKRKSTCCGLTQRCGVVISANARTESALAQSCPQAEYLFSSDTRIRDALGA